MYEVDGNLGNEEEAAVGKPCGNSWCHLFRDDKKNSDDSDGMWTREVPPKKLSIAEAVDVGARRGTRVQGR